MPELVGKNPYGKLVICNLQITPLDNCASIKIYSQCDKLMQLVMHQLGIDVPPFILHRRMKANRISDDITLQALDFDGTPATIFSSVCSGNTDYNKEPFKIKALKNEDTIITLKFYGHYNEPVLDLQINKDITERYYDLHYNPLTGIWSIEDKGTSVQFFQVPRRKLTDLQKIPDEINQTKPPVPIQQGFSVTPKTNCPHFSSQIPLGIIQVIPSVYNSNTCTTCQDKTENWLCLVCGKTYCSRYVSGHAKQHSKDSGHCVAISFSDLSIWCYNCKDYITHANLQSIVDTLSLTKFQ